MNYLSRKCSGSINKGESITGVVCPALVYNVEIEVSKLRTIRPSSDTKKFKEQTSEYNSIYRWPYAVLVKPWRLRVQILHAFVLASQGAILIRVIKCRTIDCADEVRPFNLLAKTKA